MARIGLNISVSGLTGKLIIRWVKASAPLAEVGRSAAFDFPYEDVYTINNLNRVVYIVELWRSTDGVALDQLIKDWSIDASVVNTATLETYQYQVDRGWDNTTPDSTGAEVWADPVDLDTELTDERLDGAAKSELIVHQSGYGRLLDAEYDLKPGGGIILLAGKTFDSGVPWSITVSKVDDTALDPGPLGSGGQFEGVEVITADQDFDDLATPLANKLVIADFPGSVGVVTFPDLALIPDGTHVTFNTHKGNQNYLTLQFDAGDTVEYLNEEVNVIYLAPCQTISLFFFDGVCYVVREPSNGLNRGKIEPDFDAARAENTRAYLLADEATGELNEADYPGMYAFIEALGSGVVNLGGGVGEWSYDSGGGVYPHKRKFGIKTTDPKKFRVPHLVGVSIKAGLAPGDYEKDTVYVNPAVVQGVQVNGIETATTWDSSPGEMNLRTPKTIQSDVGITETRVKSVLQIPYIIL